MEINSQILTEALKYIIGGAVTLGGAVLARKKSREDTNLASIAETVKVWKELAISNKDNWYICETKCDTLEILVREQASEIAKLKTEIAILRFRKNDEETD